MITVVCVRGRLSCLFYKYSYWRNSMKIKWLLTSLSLLASGLTQADLCMTTAQTFEPTGASYVQSVRLSETGRSGNVAMMVGEICDIDTDGGLDNVPCRATTGTLLTDAKGNSLSLSSHGSYACETDSACISYYDANATFYFPIGTTDSDWGIVSSELVVNGIEENLQSKNSVASINECDKPTAQSIMDAKQLRKFLRSSNNIDVSKPKAGSKKSYSFKWNTNADGVFAYSKTGSYYGTTLKTVSICLPDQSGVWSIRLKTTTNGDGKTDKTKTFTAPGQCAEWKDVQTNLSGDNGKTTATITIEPPDKHPNAAGTATLDITY